MNENNSTKIASFRSVDKNGNVSHTKFKVKEKGKIIRNYNQKDTPFAPRYYEDIDTGVIFTCPVCKEEHKIIHKSMKQGKKERITHGFE